jgi:hypothetical protein
VDIVFPHEKIHVQQKVTLFTKSDPFHGEWSSLFFLKKARLEILGKPFGLSKRKVLVYIDFKSKGEIHTLGTE